MIASKFSIINACTNHFSLISFFLWIILELHFPFSEVLWVLSFVWTLVKFLHFILNLTDAAFFFTLTPTTVTLHFLFFTLPISIVITIVFPFGIPKSFWRRRNGLIFLGGYQLLIFAFIFPLIRISLWKFIHFFSSGVAPRSSDLIFHW